MGHVRFDPSEIRYDSYFYSQSGSGVNTFEGLPLYQRGHGYFSGYPRQRGAGLGNVFRTLWRFLRPIAKTLAPVAASAGKAIGEEGLATTARVLNNVVQGGTLKDAVLNEGREGAINLLGKAERRLVSQRGKGSKRRRKKKISSGVIIKPNDPSSLVGRLVTPSAVKLKAKRKRVDAFGTY